MTVTVDEHNARSAGTFAGFLGITFYESTTGSTKARLPVRSELLAANGFLHAAAVVGLADTACGYGCVANLPEGATGFTTIELKSNFLGTARSGTISVAATLAHGGRSTQVWDAVVTSEDGKTIALFRCTQMILYPRG
ncbi:MAG TPA: PaaI family thioesterase [Tepidiformaceae bacterium]|nr:PaaI family thioesterase [Tepidiformaceae bacterium]